MASTISAQGLNTHDTLDLDLTEQKSEEGLEALNKFIRSLRARGARKDSTVNNFSDTFNHMWDRSRPIILDMERKITRRKQKVIISTEIEAAVNNLFEEDDPD